MEGVHALGTKPGGLGDFRLPVGSMGKSPGRSGANVKIAYNFV